MSGLGITVLAISHAPDDPKGAAEVLVAQMKASTTRPSVMADKVPPKVCVLASWELSRTGTVTVNGATPQRVSAAILVDLCNQGGAATILWTPQGHQ